MRKYIVNKTCLILIACALIGLSSCFNAERKRTTISVTDPNRRYPPILHGQTVEVVYTIENTGSEPLLVKDIQVSGGCEISSKTKIKALPAGGKGFIHVTYNGSKNIGYVKNYVTIYANLKSGDKEELTFDLNVVPNALYTRDYEEVYHETRGSLIKELVDGAENERNYLAAD